MRIYLYHRLRAPAATWCHEIKLIMGETERFRSSKIKEGCRTAKQRLQLGREGPQACSESFSEASEVIPVIGVLKLQSAIRARVCKENGDCLCVLVIDVSHKTWLDLPLRRLCPPLPGALASIAMLSKLRGTILPRVCRRNVDRFGCLVIDRSTSKFGSSCSVPAVARVSARL